MLPSSLCVSLLRQPRLFNFYRTSNSRDNLAVVQQSDDNGKKNQRKQKFKKPRFEIEMLTSVYQSSPLLSPSSKMQQSKKLIIQSPIQNMMPATGRYFQQVSHISLSFMSLHYLYYRAHGCLLLLIKFCCTVQMHTFTDSGYFSL